MWLFFKTEKKFLFLRTVCWTEIIVLFSCNSWQISESKFFNFVMDYFKSYKSRITCEPVTTIIKSWPSVFHCTSTSPSTIPTLDFSDYVEADPKYVISLLNESVCIAKGCKFFLDNTIIPLSYFFKLLIITYEISVQIFLIFK